MPRRRIKKSKKVVARKPKKYGKYSFKVTKEQRDWLRKQEDAPALVRKFVDDAKRASTRFDNFKRACIV